MYLLPALIGLWKLSLVKCHVSFMQPTLVKPVQLIITVILLTVSDVHYFSMLFASQ